jgi:uncharacterized membrane protein YgcG
VFAILALAQLALAETPPLCDVCTVPNDFVFPTGSTRRALDEATHDFRVVVFEDVGTDRGGFGSATENRLEETWSSWTTEPGFAAAEDVLIALGVSEREIRVKTGARWDADYGLFGDALLPFIDEHFIPMAKAGDLDGGLARLVGGIDAEISRRVAQEAQEAWRREHLPTVRLGETVSVPPGATVDLPLTRAAVDGPLTVVTFAESLSGGTGARGTANELLRTEILDRQPELHQGTLVLITLDEGIVHVEPPREGQEALAWPRSARLDAGDRDWDRTAAGLVQATIEAREKRLEVLQAREESRFRRRSARQQAEIEAIVAKIRREELAARGAKGFAAGVSLLLPIFAMLLWAGRVRRAREAYEAAAARRALALRNARDNLAELAVDVETRDKLVDLKLKGPVTLETLAAVGDQIATLHASLDALDRQLAEIRSAETAVSWTPGAWEAFGGRLDQPLRFDTHHVDRGLFDAPVSTHEVHPSGFMAELDFTFLDAREGWERILDAADAALSTARADLPCEDLTRMREALSAAGLPHSWLATHPLEPDADATWERLDQARREDPVHYLDLLDEAIAEDDELEKIVAELVGTRATVQETLGVMNAASLDDLRTRYSDSELDPHTRREHARHDCEAFATRLASGHDLEGVRQTATRAIAACEEVQALFAEVRAAVSSGSDDLAAAQEALSELRRRRMHQARRVAELLTDTAPASLTDAQRELSELDEDLGQAGAAMKEALAHWSGERHVEATRAAAECMREARDGAADMAELVAHIEAAVALRVEARMLFEALQKQRAKHEATLGGLGSHAKGLDLGEGDALAWQLRKDWDEPADWSARIVRLRAVCAAWEQPVATAKKRKRKHDARVARERAARAAAARRAASSYSRSSSYRSSSSRSSSYRSSRSSSRSYSSSSRSSGRSYSSGGRSAGRRW